VPRRKRVLFIQEVLLQYRVPFFQLLRQTLDKYDVDVDLVYGRPRGEFLPRRDSASISWATEVRNLAIPVLGRDIVWQPALRRALKSDLVILEQATRHLLNYPLVMNGSRGPRVAFWGHGKTYTHADSQANQALKWWVARRGAWFFAYTEGAADQIARRGFPRDHISVVQNSIDTQELRQQCRSVSSSALAELRDRLNLESTHVALFLGSLDEYKRLGFLFQAAEEIASRVPDFVLVVAGDGVLRRTVLAQREKPWIRYVGPVFGANKASLGVLAKVLLMPGRVGLLAVDSFAMETPIVTTRWAYHAPEFEYLVHGQNCLMSDDDMASYVNAVESVMKDDGLRARLVDGCQSSAAVYSLQAMVERFTTGVLSALEVELPAGR
jgi:glycosyltransferase involved in cell wall biosynthesis